MTVLGRTQLQGKEKLPPAPISPVMPARKVVVITEPDGSEHDDRYDAREEKTAYYNKGSTDLAKETPLTQTLLEPRRMLTKNSQRLVIVLVGLPARGKSFVARKLEAYMNWTGALCRIFNVGRYRRQAYAQQNNESGACDANFFDSKNEEANLLRERVAALALKDMLVWLDEEEDVARPDNYNRQNSAASTATRSSSMEYSSRVAIFDATNSTNKRRQWILEECTSPEKRGDKQTGVIFVESICDDQKLIEENFRYKVSNSPDYQGMEASEALADLQIRVEKYESRYETIEDDSYSYIKIFNLSTKLLVNHIYGRMAKELVPALMAWHIGTRPIFLCRPGQTYSGISTDGEDYVASNSIEQDDPRFLDMSSRTRRRNLRGDSLGPTGLKFRQALLAYCRDEVQMFMQRRKSVRDMADTGTSVSGLAKEYSQDSMDTLPSFDSTDKNARCVNGEPLPLKVYTSTMPRAVDTVVWDDFPLQINQISNLNPLDKGDFVGMELDEMETANRDWYELLQNDAFDTRFPGGESYRDLLRRLASVVIDMEQQVVPTLIVSHVSILQCLIAYFRNTPVDKCMSIEVPMHTILKFEPVRGGGWSETRVPLMGLSPVESASELSQMSDSSAPIWSDHQLLSPKNQR